MRKCVFLVFISLHSSVATSQDIKPKSNDLPPGARRVVAAADTEFEKARRKYQAEAKAIRAKLIVDLQAQLQAETKKGNLDGGLAIRHEIEKLKQKDPEIDGENPDLVAARKVLVGGKWRFKVLNTPYQAVWEFHDDGSLTNSDSNAKDTKWTIETQGRMKILRINSVVFPFPLNATKLLGYKPSSRENTELVRQSTK